MMPLEMITIAKQESKDTRQESKRSDFVVRDKRDEIGGGWIVELVERESVEVWWQPKEERAEAAPRITRSSQRKESKQADAR